MAKPRLLALLLVLLALALSQGMVVVVVEGRNVQLVKPVRHYVQKEEAGAGMVSTVMDYSEPKPNTNPRGGVLPPPDPTSPPAH
ncbi:hypothetical protein GUJ93_ZPchr0002g23468 [Zizania palustris]|uniref:Uncharacterized protein n=1 Tax=Zizania palustris TaxID=103762 RepID=A0A8J5RST7_ZIZPA|nr:hypothetical protein GUJ93_ZPchr0002g23468 [Zizania palustris]